MIVINMKFVRLVRVCVTEVLISIQIACMVSLMSACSAAQGMGRLSYTVKFESSACWVKSSQHLTIDIEFIGELFLPPRQNLYALSE